MSEEKKQNKKKRTLFQKIINVFLMFFLGILVLIIILFGITQTATFRDYLRDKVVEIANDELNGEVYIGKIEGTIFTSIILQKTVISMGSDTILNARKIEVRTSPLKLLAKEIFIRKFEITDATIKLVTDSEGKLNLAKLFPESEEDTTTSEFPFTIVAEEFRLTNVDFYFQNYNMTESNEIYDELVFEDLRIRDMDLYISASIDPSENDYFFKIKQFSFNPNVNSLSLQNLTGSITANENILRAEDLRIETDSSNLLITAELSGYNVFDTSGISDFAKAGVQLELEADKLNFSDVARLTATQTLNGSINAEIDAEGSMSELIVNNIEINLENSHLQTSGKINRLDNPDSLFFALIFEDTYINQYDIKQLVTDPEITIYPEYGVLRFDTLSYTGTVDDFNTRILLRTDKGSIYTNSSINLQQKDIRYKSYLRTDNFDIYPLAGVQTNLFIKSNINGIGSEPATILADINLTGDGSTIEGNHLDTFKLIADSKDKVLKYNLTAVMDTASATLEGFFDFTNETKPKYEMAGDLRNLNLALFTDDSSAESNLNFSLEAFGESFEPDSINLFLSMLLHNSTVDDIKIDSTRAIVDLQNGTEGERVINIISDLADITFIGKYSVDQAIGVLTREIEILETVINEQLGLLISTDTTEAPVIALVKNGDLKEEKSELADSVMSIKYLVDFKDFALLSLFMGSESHIEINGEMNGEIKSDGDSLSFTYNTILEYIKYKSKEDVFFLSNLNLGVVLQNSLDTANIDEMFAEMTLTTDRIFMDNNINELSLELSLNNRKALMDFSAQLENYASAHLSGGFNVSDDFVYLDLDTLALIYKGYSLTNPERIRLGYSENEIVVDNFLLRSDSSEIEINGSLLETGNQKLNFAIRNLSLNKISTTILELRPENALSAIINVNADVTGTMADPVIDLSLLIDSVTYKNQTFGHLESDVTYKNKLVSADARFIDTTINASQPALLITAELPMNLSQDTTIDLEGKPMKIMVKATDFNLAAFGDILPSINRLRGKLNAELGITGTLENPVPEGFVELSEGAFFVEANNLEYYADMKASLQGETFNLENFVLKNAEGTPDGGTMIGNGTASLEGLSLVSSQFSINGQLKVLSPESKSASPGVYGDLVIATDGNVEFTMDENGAKLKAPVIVKKAELTFPPTQGAYENTATNFVYKYVEDTTKTLGSSDLDFESLVELSRQRGQTQEIRTGEESTFDYEIDVELEDEAEIVFVLSKELNQNLSAVLDGNFSYSSVGGKAVAKGELNLLDGSTLEFIKTFEADGSIRFENELSNPYLDITATYRDYYYPSDSTGDANEIQVAVKIKLKGFLNELEKTFVREENNIAVYYGEDNIEDDNPDPTKTPTDAIMFIITGRFASDLTQSERTAAAGQFSGTATSMAGSLLGGFLNRQFGDYVRSVELRRVGTETKFNLSGRVKDFRYTIGGSTDVFEDLSQANIRIEYPFFENFLLRLERKEAITDRNTNTEMINEVGLKYKFEF